MVNKKMENLKHGYLEIILGPMFSGKTSKLIEIYKQYTFCDMDVLVINHSADTRYANTEMYTHDQKHIDCIHTSRLRSVIDENIDKFTKSQAPLAVLINEGQFFPDLYDSVYEMVNQHKVHVYVAGLDGDFKQEKFGQMLDLIPLCDKVYKLHSLCLYCKNGSKAIFSHKKDATNQSQIQIGSDNLYVPLCRFCIQSF
jgi:thymidine kinase